MMDYTPGCTIIPSDLTEDPSDIADELYELYHSKLDDAAVRSAILGIAARIKHGSTGPT